MLSITQYQKNLRHYYYLYTGDLDGVSGPKTRAAVKSFQKMNYLTVDGIYGPDTDSRLTAVIQELQRKLNSAGKYLLVVDGITGPATISAIKDFQKYSGLTVDGIAGKNTYAALNDSTSAVPSDRKVDWTKVKYFKKSEFVCECNGEYCKGYPAEMSPSLIYILEELREYFGVPILITSGLRCKIYNAQVGGIANSAHKTGAAADVYIQGISREKIKAKAYALGAKYCYYGTANMGQAVHINI